MSVIEAIFLGLIQGITEFLPVSSSGHLVLAKAVFGVETRGASLEILVHVATVFSVVTMLRRTLWAEVLPGVRLFFRALAGRVGWREAWDSSSFRLAILIVWGTVPGALAGLLLEEPLERLFSDPQMALVFLLVTGGILWTSRYRPAGERRLGFVSGTLVGLAQAGAVLPGISRSGITITTGLLRGIHPNLAAEFSFLLLVPVVLGAGLVSALRPAATGMAELPLAAAVAGFAAAYLSGCLAIGLLLRHLRRGKLSHYAYYCWAVGVLGLVFLHVR